MQPSDVAGGSAQDADAPNLIERILDSLRLGRPWLGHAVGVRVEVADDPVFGQRIVLDRPAAGRWLVISYGAQTSQRPILRLERQWQPPQEFPLPGVTEGQAFWLGLMPRDLTGIGLSVAPGSGFRVERAGLRNSASLLAECLIKRPLRLVPALYELARRDERRFRDILRGACAVVPSSRYGVFARARTVTEALLVSDLPIRLVILAQEQGEGVAETVESLRRQSHRNWTVLVAREREAGRPTRTDDPRVERHLWDELGRWGDLIGEGAAFGLLEPGDRLMPDALSRLAAALTPADGQPPDLVYGDHLRDEGGRLKPSLKPGWSPDLALVTGFHARPSLLAPSLAADLAPMPLGPFDEAAAALDLAAVSRVRRAVHVPRVLARVSERPVAAALRARLLAAHVPATSRIADGVLDLDWPLPEPAPLASIVIPSRDRLDLIARVTQGVLAETDYPAIELIVVDNGSTDPAVLDHYETLRRDPRVRIVPFPAPFNFSAMVNAGVAASSGAVVVLLNNDVAVLEPRWLDAMMRQALRPEVGAVGAKLLYGNGTLQHAGVVVGLGGRAGHILRRRPADTPGRLGRLRVAHEVSAVTAACLAVARVKYEAVGGFDAEAFPVDFNDVDFCLRLGTAGWKTVWTPKATLAHLESVSRGPSVGEKRARFEREAERFVARWREAIRHDPFYHPALSLTTFGEDLE